MPLLQIDIEARYAQFRDAMNRIERQTQVSAANMAKAFNGVKSTLQGLGVAVSAGALVSVVKNAIDAADNLNDLSKQTGIAVDTLGGLGFAAGQAGGSLESIATSAGFLNKAIAGAAGGNKEFGDAFKALGIDIADTEGKLKTADQVLVELANKFASYADGPEKVAIAQRLLGKSGAEMIGFLNDGGQAIQENIEFYKRYAGITQETADRADAFNDSLGKVNVLVGAFGRTVAAELLPMLEGVSNALLSSKENGDQFNEWAGRAAGAIQLLALGGVAAVSALDNIAIKASLAGNVMKALATLKPGEIAAAWDQYSAAIDKSGEAFHNLYQGIRNPPPPNKFDALFGKLDGQIKEEQELAETRNRFLQKYRNEDLISEKDYQKGKMAAQKEAVENTKKLYDQQMAVLMAQKKFAKNPQEAESIQGRIDSIAQKKMLVGVEKPRAPVLASGSGAGRSARQGPVIDVEARAVDSENRGLERLSSREREILADRSEFLQVYYQEDLISISNYFSGRRAAQDEALQAQQANIEQEIANLQALKPKDARGQADVDSKIDALIDKRAQLQADASRASIQLSIDETRAAKQFQETLAGINAELLEQQGLLPQAAGIRFDLGNDRIKTRLTTERDAAAAIGDTTTAAAREGDLQKLATMRKLVVAQAELNALDEVGAQVQFNLTEATERAEISARTGATTELESLRAISDARLQAVADLQQVATALDEVARLTGDPRMVEQARALQLEVDNLASSADLVRERFEEAFTSPFESAFDKLISGTASVRDVIKGLFSDIASELTRMATRDLTKQMLGEKGVFGGLVDFTARIFGGEAKAPKASADVADRVAKIQADPREPALAMQTAAIDLNRSALDQLTQAANAAAGALGSLPGAGGEGLAVPAVAPRALAPAVDASGEIVDVQSDASISLEQFGDTALSAASGVSQLAAAAGVGGGALERLPAIVSMFQSIVAATSASSAGSSAGGIFGAIANLFGGGSGGEVPYEIAASGGLFAKGGAFKSGNVIPFAKGDVFGVVNQPTYFPMKNGETGLMGEAGPEAIMPLARDAGGELAVRMVGEKGNVTLLPITRDAGGRMAVRPAAKAFANGGVFGGEEPTRRLGISQITERSSAKVLSLRSDTLAVPVTSVAADTGPSSAKGGDTIVLHVNVTPPAGGSAASAKQWGAQAGRHIQQSLRRNT